MKFLKKSIPNPCPIHPRTYQKSLQNSPKIPPKSTPNDLQNPTRDQDRFGDVFLVPFWMPWGSLWGAFWVTFSNFWPSVFRTIFKGVPGRCFPRFLTNLGMLFDHFLDQISKAGVTADLSWDCSESSPEHGPGHPEILILSDFFEGPLRNLIFS